jgi:hypothetical protein
MKNNDFSIIENPSNSNIKRAFLLCLMLFILYPNTYSQCKLERKKDDFGTGYSVSTKDVNLASVFPLLGTKKPWELVMHFLMVDGTVAFTVTHQSQKYSSSLSSIYFRFKDGTIIKKTTPSTTGTYNSGFAYEYEFTGFFITKDELELFATKDLQKFQADFSYFPDYPLVEEDIKPKSIEKIREDASCVLDELNSYLKSDPQKNEIVVPLKEYKCEFSKDKTDAFSKQRIVDTKGNTLIDEKEKDRRVWLNIVGNSTGGVNGLQFEYGLWTTFDLDKEKVQNALKFTKIELLLDDDSVISLSDESNPKFINQGQYYISYKLFQIDNSKWDKLNNTKVKTIRISNNDEEIVTQDIKPENASSIANVINCIDSLNLSKQGN